jgi:hypothetical protein
MTVSTLLSLFSVRIICFRIAKEKPRVGVTVIIQLQNQNEENIVCQRNMIDGFNLLLNFVLKAVQCRC